MHSDADWWLCPMCRLKMFARVAVLAWMMICDVTVIIALAIAQMQTRRPS